MRFDAVVRDQAADLGSMRLHSGRRLPVLLPALLHALLLGAVTLLAPEAAGAAIGTPDAELTCGDEQLPPIAEGSTAATPGRWWNPKRYGTGWDLNFAADNSKLHLTWYTFDRNRNPVWLSTDAEPLGSSSWSGKLRRHKWLEPGSDGGSVVGEVALAFYPDDPTRVAVRWQWNEVDGTARDECLFDFFREGSIGLQSTAPAPGVNAAQTGAYHDPHDSGWGLFTQIGHAGVDADGNERYVEAHVLSAYDANHDPVWLQTDPVQTTGTPDVGETRFAFSYFRAKAKGYPSGVPIHECTEFAQCLERYQPYAARLHRSYVLETVGSEQHTRMQALVDVAAGSGEIAGAPAVTWRRPDGGMVTLTRLNQASVIVTDTLRCIVPLGGSTCPVAVNWTTPDPGAKAYRVSGTSVLQVGNGITGTYLDQLAPGARVRYRLTGANGQTLSESPEILAHRIEDTQTEVHVSKATTGPATGPENEDYTVRYRVHARNAGGAGEYGPLVDAPGFGPGLQILGAAWQSADTATPVSGNQDGAGPYELVPAGTAIAAGAIHGFDVDVRFRLTGSQVSYCDGSDSGLYNRATLATEQRHLSDNGTCMEPPGPARITLAKIPAGPVGYQAATGQYTAHYTVIVRNRGGSDGDYGRLTDTPRFDAAFRVEKVSSRRVGAAAWQDDFSAPYELTSGRTPIAAAAEHRYEVVVTFAFKSQTATPSDCAGSGTGLYNLASLPSGEDSDGGENDHTCIAPPQPAALKLSTKVAGAASDPDGDGIHSVGYTVSVLNAGDAGRTYGALTQTLDFPAGAEIVDASWTGSGGAPAGGTVTGQSTFQLAPAGTAIVAHGGHDYEVTVRFRNPGNAEWTGCDDGGGLRATAALPAGQDSDGSGNDSACAEPPPAEPAPAHFAVSKLVIDGPSGTDSFSLRYEVVVRNDGGLTGEHGALVDAPAFAAPLQVTGATIEAMADGSTTSHAGGGPYPLAEAGVLEPGGESRYRITLQFAYPPDATEPAPGCDPGGGLRNHVQMSGDTVATACAEPPPPRPPKQLPPPPEPVDAEVPDAPIESLDGELPTHDPSVGAISGQAGVSGGAASYQIPIQVPPGRRGMQPELSLGYSSRSGNGIAGIGWSLSGLSSIHRCPRTPEQDGEVRAVDFSGFDRLCLDGQRLVAVSGAYGAQGAQYRTELDSFVRVTQHGGDLASTASWFSVALKSGERLSYGANSSGTSSTSRMTPASAAAPLSWLIERRIDPVGNSIHYTYTDHGSGEVLLQHIAYTGSGEVPGTRRVEFDYEARPAAQDNDRASSYLAGAVSRQTQRLTGIRTAVGGEKVRGYTLAYQPSEYSGRSLLCTVTECAYDGGSAACMAPTEIDWQDGALDHGFRFLDNLSQAWNESAPPDPATAPNAGTRIAPVADLNGDGVREAVLVVPATDGSGTARRYLASYGADRTELWRMELPQDIDTDLIYAGPGSFIADFDNDGRTDVVERDPQGNVKLRFWDGPREAITFAAAFGPSVPTGLTLPQSGIGGAGRVVHAGDMDGDGWSDLVLEVPGAGAQCARKVQVHLNRPVTDGNRPRFQVQPDNEVCLCGRPVLPNQQDNFNNSCPTNGGNGGGGGNGNPGGGPPHAWRLESIDRIADFDGDGLSDLIVRGLPKSILLGASIDRIHFGRRDTAGYRLDKHSWESQFPSGDPITDEERDDDLFQLWMDVNGDGLDDFVYPRLVSSERRGYWTIRYATGKGLGPRILTQSRHGIEHCAQVGPGSCTDVWKPRYASLLRPMDVDADGRSEILVPRALAAPICARQAPESGGGNCPTPNTAGLDPAAPDPCEERFYCPEDPATGSLPYANVPLGFDFDGDGRVDQTESGLIYPLYHFERGDIDSSLYHFDAVGFRDSGSGGVRVSRRQTGLIGSKGRSNAEDLYGDGLPDLLSLSGCAVAGERECAVPLHGEAPDRLPDGSGSLRRAAFVSENTGPGGHRAADGATPRMPEMVERITDGLGIESVWTYYPLSSAAGRGAGELPLYSLGDARYADARHFYFTSSMPVVDEFITSDGVGGFRSARYGYREAMYNHQGRGFQGFRTIVEDNETDRLRTTTTFHQKFPLVSQVESVAVDVLDASRPLGRLSEETRTYACFDTASAGAPSRTGACQAPTGATLTQFVYPDTVERIQYDAATAEGSGTPKPIARTMTVHADDPPLDGNLSSQSGWDRHGNAIAQTTLTQDLGDGTVGFERFIAAHRTRTVRSYRAADTDSWWLDRLEQELAEHRTDFGSAHALPSDVQNPKQTLVRRFVFNADRTLHQETVQPGHAQQQIRTEYRYPVPNHGLPDRVHISAAGDRQAPRTTHTTYSADGYFPRTVSNPLLHTATTVLRARDGQPAESTDANGLRTIFEYDAFGRLTGTQFPGLVGGTRLPDAGVAWIRCGASGSACPTHGRIERIQVQDGTPTTRTVLDPMGRTLRTRTRLADGTWSQVESGYDGRGLLTHQTEPHRPGEAFAQTRFGGYDVLGRPRTRTVDKDLDDHGDLQTAYTYQGRRTSIEVTGTGVCPTDGICSLSLSRDTDALGRIVRTHDAKGGRTRYWHDGQGNALAIEDVARSLIRAGYNALGQRTEVRDPNQGHTRFSYNALGELLEQTDARGYTVIHTYDALGRPETRSVAAGVDADGDGNADAILDTWRYDLGAVGALDQVQRLLDGVPEKTETFAYDHLARPLGSTIEVHDGNGGERSYLTSTQYDGYYGRPKKLRHASGDTIALGYGRYGHAESESSPVDGTMFWQRGAVDARGQVLEETLGGVLSTRYGYEPSTGQMKSVTHARDGQTLRRIDYGYDLYGNLRRSELVGVTTEAYRYDVLHRLTEATRTGAAAKTVSYGYDAVGNFTYKSDFSIASIDGYRYTGGSCGGGPNAVKSVRTPEGTRSYCYDAAGNLTGDGSGFTARYDHDNRPVQISRQDLLLTGPGGVTRISYGADGTRARQTGTDGTRLYAGSVEELLSPTAETKVHLGGYAVVTRPESGDPRIEYLLKDRLGSVDAIADSLGRITEARGYDAFGAPRLGDWANSPTRRIESTETTPRGFTAHEHLNAVAVIHMNGRAYDYQLGRFLSVDPFIQFPENSQSLNPYSYILNNPLSSTDPSGLIPECQAPPEEGKACQITARSPQDPRSAYLSKGDGTRTYTVVNNNGSLHVTAGSGPSAFRSLEAAIIGSIGGRDDGPVVSGPAIRIVEYPTATCARNGVGCERNTAQIEEVGSPHPATSAVGQLIALLQSDKFGPTGPYRTNLLTGETVSKRELLDVKVGIAALFAPVPKLFGSRPPQIIDNKFVGDAAASFLQAVYGGARETSIRTSLGIRYIDNLVLATAQEAKVGRTALTSKVRLQVMKDLEILRTPGSGVNSYEWHFFPGASGGGPTQPLRELLEQCGISVCIH